MNPSEENILLELKKRALQLVDEGKLQEAIESMVSDINNLQLLAKSPLPFDMMFALNQKTLIQMKQKAAKFTEKGELNEAAANSLISDLLQNDSISNLPKIGFIMGMSTALKEDPHLSKKRVREWIQGFGEREWLM